MSAETETRENLKSDADRCVTAIRFQLLNAMTFLERADECQAIMRGTLRETNPPIPSTWLLVQQVKGMLYHTRNLRTTATLIHENARKLDNAICQLETLEKEEANKCETR